MVELVYKPGGTFESNPGTRDSADNTRILKPGGGTRMPDKIEWRFQLSDDDCSCAFLVSVFWITKDKKILLKPFKDGLKPVNQPKSHGGKNVTGYVVDTPKERKVTKNKGTTNEKEVLEKITCVAYRPQSRKGRILTGEDQPSAKKEGVVQHFETAAICFDSEGKDTYRVLGSMLWNYTDAGLEIVRGANDKIDKGDVSGPFKDAFKDWLSKFGEDCTGRCRDIAAAKTRRISEERGERQSRINKINDDLAKLKKERDKTEGDAAKAEIDARMAELREERKRLKKENDEAFERFKRADKDETAARKLARKARKQREKAKEDKNRKPKKKKDKKKRKKK